MTEPTKPQAIVFWDASAWHIASDETKVELPGDFEKLDDAIKAAHSLEMEIVGFAYTRGHIKRPARQENPA